MKDIHIWVFNLILIGINIVFFLTTYASWKWVNHTEIVYQKEFIEICHKEKVYIEQDCSWEDIPAIPNSGLE